MSFFLNNAHFLGVILILCLFFTTLTQCRKYLKNKNVIKANKLLIFCRITSILLIIIFFIQPIFYINKDLDKTLELSVYIDNSKSMKNSISLNNINNIAFEIEKWSLNNDCNINFFLIGDSTRLISDFNFIDFSDSMTDFDEFRNNLIDQESSHFLLVADGLSPIGVNQEYNFNKKINIIGIGDRNKLKTSIGSAYLSQEEDEIFTNILIENRSINDSLELDLFQNGILLDSYKIDSFNDYEKLKKNNINYLELDNYNDLKFVLKYRQTMIDEINILSDQLSYFKPIMLFSGNPSVNTRYTINKLRELFNTKIDFFYRIDNAWNNELNYEYDNFGMIVFDNYPSTFQDLNNFKTIIDDAGENNIPVMVICGSEQKYELLEKISDIFLFDIENESVKRKFNKNSRFKKYDISNFYLIDDISPFSIRCDDDNRNLYYEDSSSAICYLGDNAIMFYPNIANIAYKAFEFNKETFFNDFIDNLFKDIYYGDNKVELFIKKNQFYNNEKIKVQLSNNSGIDLERAKLYRYNENSRVEVPIDRFFSISKPGKYEIKLINDNSKIIGVPIHLKVKDFLDEGELKGQGHRFLLDISNQSKGLYTDYGSETIIGYLNQIKDRKNNQSNIKSYNKIDFKDYLFLLMLSIFMLSFEWFFRKRNGLL